MAKELTRKTTIEKRREILLLKASILAKWNKRRKTHLARVQWNFLALEEKSDLAPSSWNGWRTRICLQIKEIASTSDRQCQQDGIPSGKFPNPFQVAKRTVLVGFPSSQVFSLNCGAAISSPQVLNIGAHGSDPDALFVPLGLKGAPPVGLQEKP